MPRRDDLRLTKVIPAGEDHRLSLFDEPAGQGAFNFHGLVWERRLNGSWKLQRELTSEEFQSNHPFRRFVSDIQSLRPETGYAVIQVGEGTKPIVPPQSKLYRYSWRLWDLVNNREVKRLKDCADPFDGYDPGQDES